MQAIFAVIAIALILFVVAILIHSKNKTPDDDKTKNLETPRKRPLLTEREEAMYNRLTSTLPEAKVLAQVSFSALLTAKSRAVRSTFDRKQADFVLCDKALQVVAVIELDDNSHKSKEGSDGYRDAMLVNAGYAIKRYKNIPDIDQLERDFPSFTKKI
ncbi:DUF2726 domain-containing protein [Comamonas odontotermitis]|uniref:DUF2726 domain-containing protein n=1 Tax=Comamonas odontotermitis TaxID=379895 RepID=UPI00366E7C31